MVEINMRKKLPKRMMIASIGKEEKQRNHASWRDKWKEETAETRKTHILYLADVLHWRW